MAFYDKARRLPGRRDFLRSSSAMSNPRILLPIVFSLFATPIAPTLAKEPFRLVVTPGSDFIVGPGEDIRLAVTSQSGKEVGGKMQWINKGGFKVVIDKSTESPEGKYTGVLLNANFKTDPATGRLEYQFKAPAAPGTIESYSFYLLDKNAVALENMLAVGVVNVIVLSEQDKMSLTKRFGDRDPKVWQEETDRLIGAIAADPVSATRKAKLEQLAERVKKSPAGREVSPQKVMNATKEITALMGKEASVVPSADLDQVIFLRKSVVFEALNQLQRLEAFVNPTGRLITDIDKKGAAELKDVPAMAAAANTAYAREVVKCLGTPPDYSRLPDTSLNIGVVRKGSSFAASAIKDLSTGGNGVTCDFIVRYDTRGSSRPAIITAPGRIANSLKRRLAKAPENEREALTQINQQAAAASALGNNLNELIERAQFLRDATARKETRSIEVLSRSLEMYYQGIVDALSK